MTSKPKFDCIGTDTTVNKKTLVFCSIDSLFMFTTHA